MKLLETYCKECGKTTSHKVIGTSDSTMDSMPFARGIFAIGTLGLSEMMRKKHCQCLRCGEIKIKN